MGEPNLSTDADSSTNIFGIKKGLIPLFFVKQKNLTPPIAAVIVVVVVAFAACQGASYKKKNKYPASPRGTDATVGDSFAPLGPPLLPWENRMGRGQSQAASQPSSQLWTDFATTRPNRPSGPIQ